MVVERYSITLSPAVAAQVGRREGPRSTVIDECLDRYFWILDQERRHLRQHFSDGEVSLIVDLLNGTLFSDPVSIQSLTWEVIDGIALDHLDQKWDIDGNALIAKVEALRPSQAWALVDAVQRYWLRVSNGEQPSLTRAEILR